jgi:hypothetical protein
VSRAGAAKHKKVAIETRSLAELQLKLAKHPSWRILEISRLTFGFKAILQKKTTAERTAEPSPPSTFNTQGCRNTTLIKL